MKAFVDDLRTKVNSVTRDGPWGSGRDDAIGLSAAILRDEDLIPTVAAPVDFPSVWNQDERRGHSLH